MTTAELQRIAAEILPPVGASVAIAMVDHEPGGQLSNGYPSGIGGRTTFRAGFLVNGRQRVALGPEFEDGRVARRLVRILNGEPSAPRPAAPVIPAVSPVGNGNGEPDLAQRTRAPATEEGQLPISGNAKAAIDAGAPQAGVAQQPERGAPSVEGASSTPAPRSTVRLCAGCGQPLAIGARPNQRTHNAACRKAASRRAAEGTGEDADSGPLAVTVSRSSERLSPGEVLARHVTDVIAASNPAARHTHPDPDPRVALGDSSVRPALLGAPDPTPMTLGLAER